MSAKRSSAKGTAVIIATDRVSSFRGRSSGSQTRPALLLKKQASNISASTDANGNTIVYGYAQYDIGYEYFYAVANKAAKNIGTLYPADYCRWVYFHISTGTIYSPSPVDFHKLCNIDIPPIQTVLQYMYLHYKENPSAYEVLKICGYSTEHFCRRFKNTTGKTHTHFFNQTVKQKRLPLDNRFMLQIIICTCAF